MVRSITHVQRFEVVATDESIGSVADVLFDDQRWAVRYLVVDTGTWLTGRRVLISPMAVTETDWDAGTLRLSMTRDRVEKSPDIDTHKPVSRQHERDVTAYYGHGIYWGGDALWGARPYPAALPAQDAAAIEVERAAEQRRVEVQGDHHLRSAREVIGYHLRASDGEIGHVEDLLVEDQSWAIRYLVIDTSNWWLGQQVLASPDWIRQVSWQDRTVDVDVSREAIKSAPPYDRAGHLDEERAVAFDAHHASLTGSGTRRAR